MRGEEHLGRRHVGETAAYLFAGGVQVNFVMEGTCANQAINRPFCDQEATWKALAEISSVQRVEGRKHMPEVRFERAEIDKLEEIANEQRDALLDRVVKEFGDKAAEALCFVLAMLFGSAFTGDTEQQHDVAAAANQILARSGRPIAWRVTPLGGHG